MQLLGFLTLSRIPLESVTTRACSFEPGINRQDYVLGWREFLAGGATATAGLIKSCLSVFEFELFITVTLA